MPRPKAPRTGLGLAMTACPRSFLKILFERQGILPVERYGGLERILFWLMKELARLGHQVTLIGHPKSRVEEHGIRLVPRDPSSDGGDWRRLIPPDTDVIHLFDPPPPYDLGFPLLVRIGGNGEPGETFHPNTVFMTEAHARLHGSGRFVHNGLDLEEYPFKPGRVPGWGNFLFLAKAKWKVKNLAHCVKACRRGRKHLQVAGGRSWIPSRFIHSHGMVDQAEKIRLLREVDALLFPVRWQEPIGNAVLEALAMGVPVVASPFGGVPELLVPEVGVVCKDYPEFERVVRDGPGRNFDPVAIRAYAEERFSVRRMAEDFLPLYRKVMAAETLNPVPPRTVSDRPPEELLPF